jgi:hypothetical protein
VTPAIEHVEVEAKTRLADELALVHFLSDVLSSVDAAQATGPVLERCPPDRPSVRPREANP